jgi:hypothetical protein
VVRLSPGPTQLRKHYVHPLCPVWGYATFYVRASPHAFFSRSKTCPPSAPTGQPALDYVKVAVGMSRTKRLYFARCVCFFKDANDVHYIALRWLTEIPGVVLDSASQMAPFTMAPIWETPSFDILPAPAILNGALVLPAAGKLWALMSPREEQQCLSSNYQNASAR